MQAKSNPTPLWQRPAGLPRRTFLSRLAAGCAVATCGCRRRGDAGVGAGAAARLEVVLESVECLTMASPAHDRVFANLYWRFSGERRQWRRTVPARALDGLPVGYGRTVSGGPFGDLIDFPPSKSPITAFVDLYSLPPRVDPPNTPRAGRLGFSIELLGGIHRPASVRFLVGPGSPQDRCTVEQATPGLIVARLNGAGDFRVRLRCRLG